MKCLAATPTLRPTTHLIIPTALNILSESTANTDNCSTSFTHSVAVVGGWEGIKAGPYAQPQKRSWKLFNIAGKSYNVD